MKTPRTQGLSSKKSREHFDAASKGTPVLINGWAHIYNPEEASLPRTVPV